LIHSLEVYDQTGNYLKNLKLDDKELTRAIIGAIGQLDAYQLPDAKGYSDTLRYLIDFTNEERQQLRNEILATSQKHFAEFGEVLDAAMKNASTTVLCSADTLAEAQKTGLKFDMGIRVL